MIKPSGKLLLYIVTFIIIREASDNKLTGFYNLSIHIDNIDNNENSIRVYYYE